MWTGEDSHPSSKSNIFLRVWEREEEGRREEGGRRGEGKSVCGWVVVQTIEQTRRGSPGTDCKYSWT